MSKFRMDMALFRVEKHLVLALSLICGSALVSCAPQLIQSSILQSSCFSKTGLVSWWDGDSINASTFSLTDIFSAHSGTYSNVSFASGKIGQGISLNCANCGITIPNDPSFNFTQQMSVSAWVKVNDNRMSATILSKAKSLTTFNTFAAKDITEINTNLKGFQGVVSDGRYVYFVPKTNGTSALGTFGRYDSTLPFTDNSAWQAFDAADTANFGASTAGYNGALILGRYVYFGPLGGATRHGRALRYDRQGSFADKASWTLHDASGAGNADGVVAEGFNGLATDGRYVYYAPLSQTVAGASGVVLRYDSQGDFSSASSWKTYDAGSTNDSSNVALVTKTFNGLVFDGRYLYLPANASPGTYLVRYDTTKDFNTSSSWVAFDLATKATGLATLWGGAFDGKYIYFPSTSTVASTRGRIVRYDTTASFTDANSYDYYNASALAYGFSGGIYDGRYAYFTPVRNQGDVLVRYDTTGVFGDAGSWSSVNTNNTDGLNSKGYENVTSDGRYLYFAPQVYGSTWHGNVLRYDTTGSDASWSLSGSKVFSDGFGAVFLGPTFQIVTSAGSFSVSSDTMLDTTNWHLVTGTYDGTTVKIYVDGVAQASQAATGDVVTSSSTNIQLGSNQAPPVTWNGMVDEVQLYSTALAESQIQVIYGASDLCK